MIIERPLIHYIEKAIQTGFSQEKIEWSLFRVGWSIKVIKRSYWIAAMLYSIKHFLVHGTSFSKSIKLTVAEEKIRNLEKGTKLPIIKKEKLLTSRPSFRWHMFVTTLEKVVFHPVKILHSVYSESISLLRNVFQITHGAISTQAPKRKEVFLTPVVSLERQSASRRMGTFHTVEKELAEFVRFLFLNTGSGIQELWEQMFNMFVTPLRRIYSVAEDLFTIRRIELPGIIISEPTKKSEVLTSAFVAGGVALPGKIRLVDIFALSSRMFRTRRMRTFLTVLGISIGIGTILFLVSLGYGLQNIIFERIATTESLLTLDVTTGEKEIITINSDSLEKIKNIKNVVEISPLALLNGQINMGSLSANASIYAVNHSYFTLGGIQIRHGEVFKEGETGAVVVSDTVMKLFNVSEPKDIIGKEVKFNFLIVNPSTSEVTVKERSTSYRITGVAQDSDASFVYLPLDSLKDLNIANFSGVKVKANSEQNIEEIRSQVVSMGFFVSAVSDILDQATKIFRVIQIVLSVFGLVALIVSAIGMFNTMTIALLERTQEIGIMKALGATPRDIWLMFLSESVIMGFLGGMGGIFTGIAGAEIFNVGLNLLAGAVGATPVNLFQRPLWFIVTIAVFSTLIGFLTGLWPAHRASKLNTLAALRYK